MNDPANDPAPAVAPRPGREVVVDDAHAFLQSRTFAGCSMVSSIPDISETGMSMPQWLRWFADSARLLADKTPPDGLLVLTQSDIRKDGRWLDKSFLVQDALRDSGLSLLARKVICRRPAGSVSSARAAFTHLLVFSATRTIDGAMPDMVPDVLPEGGAISWVRGLGEIASLACIDLVKRYAPSSTTVVDAFCGEGMLLAAANHRGLHAIGCERNKKRALAAERLVIRFARSDRADADASDLDANDDDA